MFTPPDNLGSCCCGTPSPATPAPAGDAKSWNIRYFTIIAALATLEDVRNFV